MTKSARELAARALCRKAGHPENTMFEGKPMWMSFLDDVDTVLAIYERGVGSYPDEGSIVKVPMGAMVKRERDKP